MEKTKTCKVCGRILPLSEFHKHRITKDGHTTVCKVCVSVKSLKYRKSLKKSYVVGLLLPMGFSREDITPELIETKRAIVQTKRILWNK